MEICVIRHGETDWNLVGRVQGREDIPLNENGRLQAEACGLALKKQGDWKRWDVVITSPLKRAKETAEIIAKVLNIGEVIEDEGFLERDYGAASGQLLGDLGVGSNREKFEGEEPFEELTNRIYEAFLNSSERLLGKNIIIVSHGGAINSLLAKVTDGETGSGKIRLKNACLNMFTYEKGRVEVVYYNKTAEDF